MNKQLITAIIFSALIAGLLGFYVGRYYERKTLRSNMSQRVQNFRNGNGNFQPGQGFPRNNPQGQEPVPTTETTPTPETQN
jgi:hypothetical protein